MAIDASAPGHPLLARDSVQPRLESRVDRSARRNREIMIFTGIPMVPSLNNAYPSSRTGRRFKSKEYKLWESDFHVWTLLNRLQVSQCVRLFAGKKDVRLSVQCTFYFRKERVVCLNGDNKKLDLDNRCKPLLDGMTKALGIDDSSIWNLTLYKRIAQTDSCEVIIDPMELM